jgi:hypothetical protein
MRPTATKKWAIDPFTSCEIIYFYNPRIKQFVVMMRDIATKRFIRRLRELYVCSVKSFDTRTPEEEWAYPRKKNKRQKQKHMDRMCPNRENNRGQMDKTNIKRGLRKHNKRSSKIPTIKMPNMLGSL